MKKIAEAALRHWAMPEAQATFHAKRENEIFRVVAGPNVYALRIHRQGYRTNAELRSELDWMAAVGTGGISVPTPVAAADGAYLALIDGHQVDMLRWLPGEPMNIVMEGDARARTDAIYRLGQTAARFHNICDTWAPTPDFTRPAWDSDGLLGEAPLWGRFWENPGLRGDEASLLAKFRDKAKQEIAAARPALDFGLIHADLLVENVLIDGNQMHLIDFDDGGWGFRLFELATILIRRIDDADYGALHAALLDGYGAERAIDTQHLPLFLALRATTYVGWIATRGDLIDAAQRQTKNVEIAKRLVSAYLSSD